jgi:uncharacterized iron-regulated protein
MLTQESDISLHGRTAPWRASVGWAWLLAAAVSCNASTQLAPSAGFSARHGAEHPLVGRVYAGTSGIAVEPTLLAHALQSARYVVLGETHDNPDHHRLQAQLLQQFLAAQRGAAVAFEMLDEDDASALATQAPATADELAERVAWADSGWPDFALYKPVFEVALTAHAQLIAAHPSSEHVRASMQGVADSEASDLHIDTPLPEDQVQAQHAEIREAHCGHANEAMLVAMSARKSTKTRSWRVRSHAVVRPRRSSRAEATRGTTARCHTS